jgi:nucleoside-diphosphate-sugar epimerase
MTGATTMKIFLTGGSGYLGKATLSALLRDGHTVEALARNDRANRWALVHVDDIATLYVAALKAKPGSVYVGVGGVNPTAKECSLAVARSAGLDGKVVSLTLERAREQMGPIADAFALDQQLTPARAGAELGWIPEHTDPLAVLAGGK